MAENTTNPVRRLHSILAEARTKPPERRARQVWAQVLALDNTDDSTILPVLADLLHLVRDAKTALRAVESTNSDVYLKLFRPIEKAFAEASLGIKWAQFIQHLDADTMARLELAAHQIDLTSPDLVPDPDALAELLELVDELFTATLEANLPQQLKSAILESLEVIRNAIRSYRIRGIHGLVDSLTRAVSATILHKNHFETHFDDPTVKRFVIVLERLNTIVAAASNVQAFIVPAMHQLLNPGS